jgi:signal transduction histidine kinase
MTDAERITALQAELAAVRAELQALTATVSHDLRAPLRHITSYVQLVQEDAGPLLTSEVQGFLTTISDSARQLGAQLDGLLALSRVGTAVLQLEPVELAPLVHEVVEELTAQAARQSPARTVQWQVADALPTVQADPALLRQVLGHVLGNALKFTAPRETAVIAIAPVARFHSADAASGLAAVQVQDNGVGYNPAMQSALFKVFGRLHSAQQFPGLGMGLALTAKALQRMGGTVAAQGVVDGGCCVTLALPLA